jgi:predicted amidohydrolase
MRTKENAFFGVLADQAGRAGYVDRYPRDHENQPHHPGAAMIFGPEGALLASSQCERIRDEMVVATLDAASLAGQRAHPNYQLRTRRPELYGELTRDRAV